MNHLRSLGVVYVRAVPSLPSVARRDAALGRKLLKVAGYNGSVQEMGAAGDLTSPRASSEFDRLVLADDMRAVPAGREMCDGGKLSVFGPQLGIWLGSCVLVRLRYR